MVAGVTKLRNPTNSRALKRFSPGSMGASPTDSCVTTDTSPHCSELRFPHGSTGELHTDL